MGAWGIRAGFREEVDAERAHVEKMTGLSIVRASKDTAWKPGLSGSTRRLQIACESALRPVLKG